MALTEIDHLTDEMQHCMDNCLEAAQACEWCADACANEGGRDGPLYPALS